MRCAEEIGALTRTFVGEREELVRGADSEPDRIPGREVTRAWKSGKVPELEKVVLVIRRQVMACQCPQV